MPREAKPNLPVVASIQRLLLAWYRRCRRDLPWRRTRDPYAVWVSEVMLQQTRVDTVIPYYQRFLRLFPTVRALAASPLPAVLKAWEGLGYYSRARNLHAAARLVTGELGGEMPATAEGLRRLPGIGRYTAGAISSIAYGQNEPLVDGNVQRVLCRLAAIAGFPDTPATQRRLWKLATTLLPAGQAGDFNQALMELGATLCTPDLPRCGECPVGEHCRARAAGSQHKLPRRRPTKRVPHYDVVAAVIYRRGRVLIDQRPADGLLGGLWEFPGGKVQLGETHEQALRREVCEEVALRLGDLTPLTVVRHAYSHFKITMHVYECRQAVGRARAIACQVVRWVRPEELDQYAFPKANHTILKMLR